MAEYEWGWKRPAVVRAQLERDRVRLERLRTDRPTRLAKLDAKLSAAIATLDSKCALRAEQLARHEERVGKPRVRRPDVRRGLSRAAAERLSPEQLAAVQAIIDGEPAPPKPRGRPPKDRAAAGLDAAAKPVAKINPVARTTQVIRAKPVTEASPVAGTSQVADAGPVTKPDPTNEARSSGEGVPAWAPAIDPFAYAPDDLPQRDGFAVRPDGYLIDGDGLVFDRAGRPVPGVPPGEEGPGTQLRWVEPDYREALARERATAIGDAATLEAAAGGPGPRVAPPPGDGCTVPDRERLASEIMSPFTIRDGVLLDADGSRCGPIGPEAFAGHPLVRALARSVDAIRLEHDRLTRSGDPADAATVPLLERELRACVAWSKAARAAAAAGGAIPGHPVGWYDLPAVLERVRRVNGQADQEADREEGPATGPGAPLSSDGVPDTMGIAANPPGPLPYPDAHPMFDVLRVGRARRSNPVDVPEGAGGAACDAHDGGEETMAISSSPRGRASPSPDEVSPRPESPIMTKSGSNSE